MSHKKALLVAALGAALFVGTSVPVSAGQGATQIAGTGGIHAFGEWTEQCPEPEGYEDFNFLTLYLDSGNLQGCWYTLVEDYSFNPNEVASPVVYHETGRKVFIGSLYDGAGNWLGSGTFETTYRFTGKYEDSSLVVEIHGRCQHPLVAGRGTGVFADLTGRVDFKDDVDTGVLYYSGHLK